MRHPIPTPCILDRLERLPHRQRWRDQAGDRLYEWDALHGEIEVYNRRGRHLGVIHPLTGDLIKPAVKGRWIDV